MEEAVGSSDMTVNMKAATEDGGSRFLRNVGNRVRDYNMSLLKRPHLITFTAVKTRSK
jgi:hypothetical protein